MTCRLVLESITTKMPWCIPPCSRTTKVQSRWRRERTWPRGPDKFPSKPRCKAKQQLLTVVRYPIFPHFPEAQRQKDEGSAWQAARAAARSTVARTSLTKSQHYLSSQRDLTNTVNPINQNKIKLEKGTMAERPEKKRSIVAPCAFAIAASAILTLSTLRNQQALTRQLSTFQGVDFTMTIPSVFGDVGRSDGISQVCSSNPFLSSLNESNPEIIINRAEAWLEALDSHYNESSKAIYPLTDYL